MGTQTTAIERNRGHEATISFLGSLSRRDPKPDTTAFVASRSQFVDELKSVLHRKFNGNGMLLVLSGSSVRHSNPSIYSDIDVIGVNMRPDVSAAKRLDLKRLDILTAATKETIENLSSKGIYVVTFYKAGAHVQDLARYEIAYKKGIDHKNVKVEIAECLFYPSQNAMLSWKDHLIAGNLFATGNMLLGNDGMVTNIMSALSRNGHSPMQVRDKFIRDAEVDIANSYIHSTSNIHLSLTTLVMNAVRSSKLTALYLARAYVLGNGMDQQKSFDEVLERINELPKPLKDYVEAVIQIRAIAPENVQERELIQLHKIGEAAVDCVIAQGPNGHI
jgi:hypothetical protein